MSHSSVVGLLAFALFLFACVTVSADGNSGQLQDTNVKIQQAQQAVDGAKDSINNINRTAESEVTKVKAVLDRVETLKRQVDEAKSQAEQALSQVEEAVKENEEAKTLVEKIKEISNTVSTSYQKSKGKVEKTNASLVAVLEEVEKLKTEWDKEEAAIKVESANYANIKTQASQIQNKADALSANITAALTIMGEEDSIENDMEKTVKDVQLKSLKVRGIVAVAKIKTMIVGAEGIITKTKNKKEEVNDIVAKMQTLKEKAPTESIGSINAMFQSANNELTIATGAVENTTKADADMTQQKETAEAALTKVKTTTEVSEEQQGIANAQEEVKKAEECVEKVTDIVKQLTIGLKTTENSVINANVSKQNMEKALSTTTSAPTPEEVKETAKAYPPLGDGTGTAQKDAMQQSTITDTEQPMSKNSPSQSDDTADKLKDTLSNSAQNVPTTALTSRKAPAPGAKNDSAMTVSVPLLVALIASAVLQ